MRIIGSWIASLVGMAFFWRYFYAQAFFNALFSPDSFYSFFGIQLHASFIFLAELILLGLLTLVFRKAVTKVLRAQKILVVLATALGSGATFLFLNLQTNDTQDLLTWILPVFIALGFIANCLAWSSLFSSSFGPKSVFLLGASYLTSLSVFPTLSFFLDTSWFLSPVTPIVSGLAWFLSASTSPAASSPYNLGTKKLSFFKSLGPYVPLFIIFLIAGSAIRGIVDSAHGDPFLRWAISLAAGFGIFLLFRYFCEKPPPQSDSWNILPSNAYSFIEKAVFKTWIVLVSLFLIGLFAALLMPPDGLGGNLVVIARSFLDLFLWVLLCNLACHKRLPSVPLFVVCVLFVEAVSWCLSYVVVPFLLHSETIENGLLLNHIGLLVIFVLFVSVTIVLSSIVVKRQVNADNYEKRSLSLSDSVPPKIAEHYGLTKREVEIVNLFVQGRSLRKVALLLVISTSTAQSHIKSVYRKLDIHSKDELVDAFREWTL